MNNVRPTSGQARLDVLASNIEDSEINVTIRPPLVSDEGLPSDHEVVHAIATISGVKSFTKKSFTVRRRSKKADSKMELA